MFNIGPIEIRLYGLVVGLGIVAGAYVAERVRQLKIDNGQWTISKKTQVWDALPWIVISGIIGARLYHVVDLWEEVYSSKLILIPQVWTGGLGIYGGIGGGVLGLWMFCKRHGQNFAKWLDLVGVGAPLGQAVGRWGNYFNQELYGQQTDLPWKIYIDAEKGYFHPLFLYESVWNLITFLILFGLVARKRLNLRSGTIFTLYLLFYAIGRFFLERMRIEEMVWRVSIMGIMVPMAQLVSGVLVLGSVYWLVRTRNDYTKR